MTKERNLASRFAICVKTNDPDLSTLRMVYQVLPGESAARSNYIRVVDNEGEDYVYPADHFVPIDLPCNLVEPLADSFAPNLHPAA